MRRKLLTDKYILCMLFIITAGIIAIVILLLTNAQDSDTNETNPNV